MAIASSSETEVLRRLVEASNVTVRVFDDLSLPEITALTDRARLFIGNDSGIAHMAAAVGTPAVVIFGPSNRDHWFPWTDAPNRMVYNELPGRPCPIGICSGPSQSTCIHNIETDKVLAAANELLSLADAKKEPKY
jgi:ADP-heptose:LPS heptosyltransferase